MAGPTLLGIIRSYDVLVYILRHFHITTLVYVPEVKVKLGATIS